jgi:hypothetical protein
MEEALQSGAKSTFVSYALVADINLKHPNTNRPKVFLFATSTNHIWYYSVLGQMYTVHCNNQTSWDHCDCGISNPS